MPPPHRPVGEGPQHVAGHHLTNRLASPAQGRSQASIRAQPQRRVPAVNTPAPDGSCSRPTGSRWSRPRQPYAVWLRTCSGRGGRAVGVDPVRLGPDESGDVSPYPTPVPAEAPPARGRPPGSRRRPGSTRTAMPISSCSGAAAGASRKRAVVSAGRARRAAGPATRRRGSRRPAGRAGGPVVEPDPPVHRVGAQERQVGPGVPGRPDRPPHRGRPVLVVPQDT